MSENAEKLDVWREEIEARIIYAGLSKSDAKGHARAIMARVLNRIGGEHIYLPQGRAVIRDSAVASVRNGEPPTEICRQLGITRATLRRWVREADPG